jgi:hypothetical protein
VMRGSGVSGREDKDRERRAAGWFSTGASFPSGRPPYIIIVYKFTLRFNGIILLAILPSSQKECNYEKCAGQTSLTLNKFIVNSITIYVSN